MESGEWRVESGELTARTTPPNTPSRSCKMVVNSSSTPGPGSTIVNGQRRQVTSITKRRLLSDARQRGLGCLYEFKVQFDGCKMANLAEWVDEKDLEDCVEIIKEFLGTTTGNYYYYVLLNTTSSTTTNYYYQFVHQCPRRRHKRHQRPYLEVLLLVYY